MTENRSPVSLQNQRIGIRSQPSYDDGVSKKSYDQYCGIAAALDVVGDRWTLLILRELSFGRRRFTDLRTDLPGIASNLLTDRLRDLEQAGLVEQQELPPPAARTVYALSTAGKRVGPVLRELARFGLPLLTEPVEGQVRPRTAVHGALAPHLDTSGAAGRDLLLRFDLDGEQHWLHVRGGRLERPDREAEPDLVFTGSAAALIELCRGTRDLEQLGPLLSAHGSQTAKRAFTEMFPVGAVAAG
ncbi:MAG TPA: helix-turn-helix domain-containing protein [Ornithinibacter sp.]|nr:helix-turn-helix domain-containing protein [Ornithinibacter sp.]